MNENLLKVVDALINDDETMASEYLRQALVDKVRVRIGINESLQTELEQTLNQDEQQKLFKKFIVDYFKEQYDNEIESLEDELFDIYATKLIDSNIVDIFVKAKDFDISIHKQITKE